MKKLFALALILMLFTIVGCEGLLNVNNASDDGTVKGYELSSSQSLGLSTYLASGLLQETDTVQTVASLNNYAPSFLSTEATFQIDSELDEVNFYFNKLKVFLDQGLEQAINLEETESTREGYDYQVNYTINDEAYVIYYAFVNEIDVEDEDDDEIEFELSGLMIIDGNEYELIGANEIEEDEAKMWFKTVDVSNSGNYVYVEIEEEEGEQKFKTETVINGVEKKSEFKFENEEDETKVELKLNNNGQESEFEFKREMEDEGLVYKFEYKMGNTEGEVKITEEVDEQGKKTYRYEIEEEGKKKEVRKKDEDEDDDDEEDVEI